MNMNDFVCFNDGEKIKKEILCAYKGNSKNVEIPSGFEVIEFECFKGNENIESVIIPESVIMIVDGAFTDCPNLKKITIPSNLYSVCSGAFGDARTTANILLSNNNYMEENGFIINKKNKSLLFALDTTKTSYTIPAYIEHIGRSAFANCSNVKEIVLSASVKTIQAMGFFFCESLESISFPATLKYIGTAAFERCSNLKNFVLPSDVEIEQFGNEVLAQQK